MRDSRVQKFAQVLVDYSTQVAEGDVVLISADIEAAPLVKAVYELCILRGAKHVEYQFSCADIDRSFINLASKAQIANFPEHRLRFMEQVTVYIGISAPSNSMVHARSNQDNLIARSKVLRPIQDQRVRHTRWVVTDYPTQAGAQDARMSLEEYEDYLFAACCIDWEKESVKQEILKVLMEQTDRVRIKASDTDISFSIKGLPAVKCDGRLNMPDGEVFTAPVRNSVNGYIRYNCPSIYNGQEFNEVRLEFVDGCIVGASAAGNPAALNKILDTDPGARYIGEFAIGVNPGITEPMRNILFDEKIFGSIHLTPGQAYDECDNGNRSAVHWDLVKNLTGDGEIWFDDVLIQKDGVFVHDALRGLNPA